MSTATETADSPYIDRSARQRWTPPEGAWVFVEAGTRAGEGSGLGDALDAAYHGKYGRSSSAVARITADVARAMPCASTPPEPFTPDYLNDEKDTTWTRTPAPPR